MMFSEELYLSSPTAKTLYEKYAKNLPIIDYHCHLSPKEICENRRFSNLGELWLAHDHYKWRAMRAFGVDEELITGGAQWRDKFYEFAKIMPALAGNPLYIWCALELKRYFGVGDALNENNANDIYDKTAGMIDSQNMTPSYFINKSNVEFIATTDDPADDLTCHERIARDAAYKKCKITPAFRPDKAMSPEKPGFTDYVKKLAKTSGVKINDFKDLLLALEERLKTFRAAGSVLNDNGLAGFTWCDYTQEQVEAVFRKAVCGAASRDGDYMHGGASERGETRDIMGGAMRASRPTDCDNSDKGGASERGETQDIMGGAMGASRPTDYDNSDTGGAMRASRPTDNDNSDTGGAPGSSRPTDYDNSDKGGAPERGETPDITGGAPGSSRPTIQSDSGYSALTDYEINIYRSAFLFEMSKLYYKYGFTAQYHIGAYRNANSRMFAKLGPDSGYDSVDDAVSIRGFGRLFDKLDNEGSLPRTVIYPLDINQYEAFATLAANFCGRGRAWVQLGAPWWFNDQYYGIIKQFESVGSLYPVALSIGMLTDSRSFLSYPRHELYRRTLCSYLCAVADRGEYFSGEEALGGIIRDVCYLNAKRLFNP